MEELVEEIEVAVEVIPHEHPTVEVALNAAPIWRRRKVKVIYEDPYIPPGSQDCLLASKDGHRVKFSCHKRVLSGQFINQ